MESGPGALPDFKCWRAAVNSLCEKLSEIFTASGVVALQRIRHLFNYIFTKYIYNIQINTYNTTTTLFTPDPAKYGTTLSLKPNITNNKTPKNSWNHSKSKTNVFTTYKHHHH